MNKKKLKSRNFEKILTTFFLVFNYVKLEMNTFYSRAFFYNFPIY